MHEPWWTATARHADIVLPATTSLERNDIGGAPRDQFIIAMQQAIEPVGEARNDFAIFSELARRLGCDAAYTEGRDEMALAAASLRRCRASAGTNAGGASRSSTRSGRKAGPEIPRPAEEYVLFGGLPRRSGESIKLRTPSGGSSSIPSRSPAFGYDDCPPHPTWIEPMRMAGREDRRRRYPLHLVSSQPRDRLHSQMDRGPVSARRQDRGPRGGRDQSRRRRRARHRRRRRGARATTTAALVSPAPSSRDTVRAGVVRLSCGAWYDPADRTTSSRFACTATPTC